VDSDNQVIKYCQEGLRAEVEGRLGDARRLFLQAWDARRSDYEACVAAHYLARHQESAEDRLYWNQMALKHAKAVGDDTVKGFYASLYLNMGWSYENLGNMSQARAYYDLASIHLDDLPAGPYRDVVASGIENGRKRLDDQDNVVVRKWAGDQD
jgi:tetratricopeptide (TPR) repeat protein